MTDLKKKKSKAENKNKGQSREFRPYFIKKKGKKK